MLDAALLTGAELVATSVDGGDSRVTLTAHVKAGTGYELWVNSYYGSQFFTIRADLIR